VSESPITGRILEDYRSQTFADRCSNNVTGRLDKSPDFYLNAAEKGYADRTGHKVITALIELTYRCSAGCIHCYNPGRSDNGMKTHPDELTLEDYKDLIDQLYDEGAIRICLTGGDPFSRNDIWDIIEHIHNKGIAFEIYTNGIALRGNENKLADYFPCDVGISIYSDRPEIHDAVTRVRGSFEKSTGALDSLARLGVPLAVKCCVMKTNFDSYQGVAGIAAKAGAVLQLETSIFDSLDGNRDVSTFLRLDPEQMAATLKDKNNPLYIGPEVADWGRFPKNPDDIGCRAGIQTICIRPDGRLSPCCSFNADIGDIRKAPLKEILNDSPFLKQWKELRLSIYEDCGKKDYCEFCKLCPGLNYNEHGTPVKAAENNCYVAKIRFDLYKRLNNLN